MLSKISTVIITSIICVMLKLCFDISGGKKPVSTPEKVPVQPVRPNMSKYLATTFFICIIISMISSYP